MTNTLVDVIYKDKIWQVFIHEPSKPTRRIAIVARKRVARLIGIGAAKALQSEVQIRIRNGQIKEKNSYGRDNPNVRG